jgi:two-component system cell cycle sensor histidine kinase/response regulator CckA
MSEDTARTILLVEDEESVRNVTRRILERAGYRVLVAATPIDAMRLVGEHRTDIDLLVSDLVMPEMGGQELASHIVEVLPAVRVLYMSGYSDEAIGESGAAFIQKPYAADDLVDCIRALLDDG